MPVDEEIMQILHEMKAGYIALAERHRKLLAVVAEVGGVDANDNVYKAEFDDDNEIALSSCSATL